MIIYDLACDCGYTFEGWFQDRQDFEEQQTASFLVCPDCGSWRIRKILSPIRTQSSRNSGEEQCFGYKKDKSTERGVDPLETLRNYIYENFEDVGTELATESLKIHYGVSEPRNLRGVTTEQEEKKLQGEGINLLKIPLVLKSKTTN